MNQYNPLAVSEKLQADPSLSTLFEILRGYGEIPAAMWLKGGQECSLTFAEMTRRADDYAACLYSLAPEGGWMALAVDTCVEWPGIFWGMLRSGHNVLLLDASASDSVLQGLLDEAGCRLIITKKPRALAGNCRQIDFRTVAEAPRVIGYTPVWGEYVAMCTSGTTGRSRVFAYSGETLIQQTLNSSQIYRENKRIIGDENRRFLAFLPFHQNVEHDKIILV